MTNGHTDDEGYPRTRGERIIAVCRLLIVSSCLLALRVDSSGSSILTRIGFALLAVYFLYVFGVTLHLWLAHAPTHRWRVADQAVDVTVGLLVVSFTGGASSPFFAYLSFPMLFAALRWHWRGALGAGAPITLAFFALGALPLHRGTPFVTDSFIVRTVYLAALTGLLCRVGAYEQRLGRALRAITRWNPPLRVGERHIGNVVRVAADVIGAPRAMLAWTERGGPTRQMALWDGSDVRCWQEDISTTEGLVAESLTQMDFLGADVASPTAPILWVADGRLHQQRGTRAIPSPVQHRFGMRSVIAVRLHGELIEGRLFLLDVPRTTTDDLLTARLLARRVEGCLEYLLTARQLAAAAAADERIQLARNVHDGALQALTGMTLQLEAARRLIRERPEDAQALLLELQDVVGSEHRTLRRLVTRLQRAESSTAELDDTLSELITALSLRIERQWNVRVHVLTPIVNDGFEAMMPRAVSVELYQILREALVNAARHAHARTITLSMGIEKNTVVMVIADDGEGFPFTGRHDLARLLRYDIGPTVIRDRVAALGGTLTIESTRRGARLEIGIPLAPSARLSVRAPSTKR